MTFLDMDKLDTSKNYIYVCNHQSNFDTVIMAYLFPSNCYIIAKDSLKFVPYFGQMYALTGNFYIKRGHSEKAKETLAKIIKRIKKLKCSIFILPQGTRSYENKVTKLKRGFIQLAKETQTDIMPFVISSYKASDILFHFRNKKPIYTKICDKIDYRLPEEEILSKLQNLMNGTIYELDSQKIDTLNVQTA